MRLTFTQLVEQTTKSHRYAVDALQMGRFSSHGSSLEDFIEYYEDDPWWDTSKPVDDVLASSEFRQGFVRWMQLRYKYAYKQLREDIQRAGGFPLPLVRVMNMPASQSSKIREGSSLGVFWAIDDGWYDVTPAMGNQDDPEVYIRARATEKDVNWTETMRSRMDYQHGDSEGEIYLKANTTIEVIGGDIPSGVYKA